jgi:hypothetical protein
VSNQKLVMVVVVMYKKKLLLLQMVVGKIGEYDIQPQEQGALSMEKKRRPNTTAQVPLP